MWWWKVWEHVSGSIIGAKDSSVKQDGGLAPGIDVRTTTVAVRLVLIQREAQLVPVPRIEPEPVDNTRLEDTDPTVCVQRRELEKNTTLRGVNKRYIYIL